jgi:hypothetical protein
LASQEQSAASGGACARFRAAWKQMHGYFGTDADGIDPLVALVRHDPLAAYRFVQVLMLGGGLASLTASVTCILLLAVRWWQCTVCCDRPLRLWLLVHSVFQLFQVPVRLWFSAKLYRARLRVSHGVPGDHANDVTGLVRCAFVLTSSLPWRAARFVSLMTYVWLSFGVVWVMNSSACDECVSGLKLTCITMMMLIGIRALLVAKLFQEYFGDRSRHSAQDKPKSVGATHAEVESLPCHQYRHIKDELRETSASGCVVCCSDYLDRDMVRILPCSHHFHQRCVDKWLQRSTRCPLCMGCIRNEADAAKCCSRVDGPIPRSGERLASVPAEQRYFWSGVVSALRLRQRRLI